MKQNSISNLLIKLVRYFVLPLFIFLSKWGGRKIELKLCYFLLCFMGKYIHSLTDEMKAKIYFDKIRMQMELWRKNPKAWKISSYPEHYNNKKNNIATRDNKIVLMEETNNVKKDLLWIKK